MARPTAMLSLEEVRPRRWEILLFVTAALLLIALAASLSLRPTYRLEAVESAPGCLVLGGAGVASLLAVGDSITVRTEHDPASVALEGVVIGRSSDGLVIRVAGAGTAPAGVALLVEGPEVRAVSVLASRIVP